MNSNEYKIKVTISKALLWLKKKRRSLEGSPINLPKFIIVGAQKCGTSSLHALIEKNSLYLSGSYVKETDYFLSEENKIYNIYDYGKYFPGPKDKVYFESSPNYLYYKEIPKRIKKVLGDIKIVILIRDPVDRAYSAYNHYKSVHGIWANNKSALLKQKCNLKENKNLINSLYCSKTSFPSFEECIKYELNDDSSTLKQEPSILRRGLYEDQILRYEKRFGSGNVLLLHIDELSGNIKKLVNKIEKFVGTKTTLHIKSSESEIKNRRSYNRKTDDHLSPFLQAYYEKTYIFIEKRFKQDGR